MMSALAVVGDSPGSRGSRTCVPSRAEQGVSSLFGSTSRVPDTVLGERFAAFAKPIGRAVLDMAPISPWTLNGIGESSSPLTSCIAS